MAVAVVRGAWLHGFPGAAKKNGKKGSNREGGGYKRHKIVRADLGRDHQHTHPAATEIYAIRDIMVQYSTGA